MVYNIKPHREGKYWTAFNERDNPFFGEEGVGISLPVGSIERLTGRAMAWGDEPVELIPATAKHHGDEIVLPARLSPLTLKAYPDHFLMRWDGLKMVVEKKNWQQVREFCDHHTGKQS